ncbi:hypothetical protein D7S89_16285 [Trinickia fusca]|uniref:Uncharacterized protein n=1 Tax=Trinickia fusca TaxID=2419777 RepID=A0A494XFI4_9BURK|nr:hypothetical protein D7S89_16285 [Trinickia fusca]
MRRAESVSINSFARWQQRREIEAWHRDDNETRRHMALNDLTPAELARQYSLRPVDEDIKSVDN